MNPIRIHPATAGLVFAGVALLSVAQGQQPQQVPRLTAEQREILDHMSIVYLDDGQGGQAKTIRFTGVNVQVVNGTGASDVANGTGNLIVGYNETRPAGGDLRTGSHNLVGGIFSNYGSVCGLVVGDGNSILAPQATVTGGGGNSAIGLNSTVTGGAGNSATGANSTVGGGYLNAATTYLSSVVGGGNNRADFEYSTIIGGNANRTLGGSAVVVGGELNVASASLATVVGGELNQASGYGSTVGGGRARSVGGTDNWAAGGLFQSQ